jgi:hypothetical protein
LTSVEGNFQTAYNSSPTNPSAATGFAITEAALVGEQYANEYGAVIPGLSSNARVSEAKKAEVAAQSSRFSALGQTLVLWKLPQLLQQGAVPHLKASDFLPVTALDLPAKSADASTVSPAQVQTDLTNFDADLAKVETALSVGINSPGFTYTIPSPSSTNTTYKIGTVELQLLETFVEVVRSTINLSLIYSADDSNYPNGSALASTVFATQLANPGSTISPTAYLPGAPFLTIESDGTQRGQNVISELNNAVGNGVAAVDGYEARNNSGYLLGAVILPNTSQLNNGVTEVKQYQQYLTSPQNVVVNINGDTNTQSVAIGAFLSNPPSNLYFLWPTLTTGVDPNDSVDDVYTASASAYADPTFGGLFPGGLVLSDLPLGNNPYSDIGDVTSTTTVSDFWEGSGGILNPLESYVTISN